MKTIFDNHQTKDINFRIKQLQKLKNVILEFENDLYEALNKDLGKSKVASYITEIGFCLREISLHLKNIKSWSKPQKVKTNQMIFPMAKSFTQREPLGNILIISPWNYPLMLSLMPMIGAISAGNCVTLKPSELSKHTSDVLKKIIEKVFDKDYVKVVLGGASETQKLLKQKFDYIFFTGGEVVGKIVMKAASENLTPVTLELGGKSPTIVDENCNLEKTAARITHGKFSNAGQTCIAPDYLLVNKKIKEKLVEKIKENILSFFGNDIENSKDLGKIINKKHFMRCRNYLQNTKIIFGGEVNQKTNYISPTLIENCEDEEVMQEEIFGPILPIIEYSTVEEAIEFVNKRPKPLALYIFSNDKNFQNTILQKTSSGGVSINDTLMHIVNDNLPFGGVGNSGFGKYFGKASFETFSNLKGIFKNTTLFDIPNRFPPTDEKNLNFFKKIFK